MLFGMLEAFAWGFLAAAPLLAGGAYALKWRVGEKALGMIMAFGSGVLISAVAFDLVEEAVTRQHGTWSIALGLFAGSAGWEALGRSAGRGLRSRDVLGIVLDGIPESIVLGLTLIVSGSISAAFLVAVVLSNVPEAFEHGGKLVGVVTTFGFALAFAISALE